jgi:Flp pilus assembly protein CpaB
MAKKRQGAKKTSGVGALGFTLLALIFTASTAFFLSQLLKDSKIDSIPMKSVVVAAKDIQASDLLKSNFFKVVKLPINAIPEEAFRKIDQLFPEGENSRARVLISKVYRNEIILPQRLSDPKQGTGFASRVKHGYRGFSIEVDRRITRANLIYPGAFVDVLTTMRRPDTRDSITKLVVQGVEVLAVNGITEPEELRASIASKKGRSSNDVITLHVDPDQGESLTLASREGEVDVLLRNTNDTAIIDMQGISSSELTKSDLPEEDVAQKGKSAKKKRMGRRRRNRFRKSAQRSREPRQSRSRSGSGQRGTTTIELSQ